MRSRHAAEAGEYMSNKYILNRKGKASPLKGLSYRVIFGIDG